MADIYSDLWSESAMNNDANFPDGWAGGTAFPNIPPIGREMMAAIKREWNLSHPTLTAGGNGDVITLTPAVAISEYKTGQIFAAKLNANLGAAGTTTRTLNVSGKGAKKIYLPSFSGGYAQTSQSGGEARSGQVVFFCYDATLDSGLGGFVIYSFLPRLPGQTESIEFRITGETEAVVNSLSDRLSFRMPYAFTITGAKSSLNGAQTSGSKVGVYAYYYVGGTPTPYFNIPYLTIDNGELTSDTASSPLSLSAAAALIPADTEIRIVALAGDGTAVGLKFWLLGHQP